MIAIHSKLKSHWRSNLAGCVFFLLAACAHSPVESAYTDVASPQFKQAPTGSAQQGALPLDVNQIASANTDLKARQISSNVDATQLTIGQLKAYADRCAPDSSLPQGDLDCSELSLQVREVFRSDDLIQKALITLDRLGRNGADNTGQNELKQNSRRLSFSARAIASGVLDNPPPIEQPQEPEPDNLENISNGLGFGQNANAIINSGG